MSDDSIHPVTYLFAGGGTGGHLTPGLAVAAELKRTEGECRILFVGSDRPIEQQMIAGAGYPHVALPVESLQSLLRRPLRFLWRNWQAYRQCKALLRAERPATIIGLGGFASMPLVMAAIRSGLPAVLLEQNTIPGRANRTLCRAADAVCVAFEESRPHFDRACPIVVTGNPVRGDIVEAGNVPKRFSERLAATDDQPSNDDPGKPVLLILGGSQGAAGLNDAIAHMLRGAPETWRRWRIIHQAGSAQCQSLRSIYSELGLDCDVAPFFSDMAECYARATLVIARAGATTLAELACTGCPAVLVPYPHAADNHQLRNAELFSQRGAARIVAQAADPAETARALASSIESLLHDRSALTAMSEAMRALARPDAARNVVQVLQSVIAARIK